MQMYAKYANQPRFPDLEKGKCGSLLLDGSLLSVSTTFQHYIRQATAVTVGAANWEIQFRLI